MCKFCRKHYLVHRLHLQLVLPVWLESKWRRQMWRRGCTYIQYITHKSGAVKKCCYKNWCHLSLKASVWSVETSVSSGEALPDNEIYIYNVARRFELQWNVHFLGLVHWYKFWTTFQQKATELVWVNLGGLITTSDPFTSHGAIWWDITIKYVG